MALSKMSATVDQILAKMPERPRRKATVSFWRGSGGEVQAFAHYVGQGASDFFRQTDGSTPEGAAVNLLHEVSRG